MAAKISDPECILSVTTWKGRIFDPKAQTIIYSFTRQKTSRRYIVTLVLSDEEFPGRENDIPEGLVLMDRSLPNFEIIWTHRNTRALKKLNPAMEKYPGLPIMTTDDDCVLREDAVEQFMNYAASHPGIIVSEDGFQEIGRHIWTTGIFRLYPPGSVATLPDSVFDRYFSTSNDDLFNAIRAAIAGTATHIVHLGICHSILGASQSVALYSTYSKINWPSRVSQFVTDFPEFKSKLF